MQGDIDEENKKPLNCHFLCLTNCNTDDELLGAHPASGSLHSKKGRVLKSGTKACLVWTDMLCVGAV